MTAKPPVRSRLMLAMNAATAVTFVGFYLSIGLIEAATASALETAVAPVALIALSPLVLGRPAAHRYLASALLALLGLALAWYTFALTPANRSAGAAVAGLGLALLAGGGMATISLLSRRFGDLGVSPVTVTAHRFHFTYLLAAALWLVTTPTAPDGDKLLTYAILGLVAVVLPLFLLQVGFQMADPLAGISVVVSLPGLTYLVQLMNGTQAQPLTLTLLVAIMLAALAQSRRQGLASRSST